MKSTKLMTNLAIVLIAVASLWIVGCDNGTKPNPVGSAAGSSTTDLVESTSSDASTRSETRAGAEEEHGHKDGQHGGIIVSLGRDSYHVEAVVAADGQIRLFTLGKDETRVIDVEAQALKGYIKADGDSEAQEISFEPAPQEGDAANRTSLFIAKVPAALVGRSLDVTIPNIRIDGERFRLGFRTAQEEHADSAGMPAKVADSAEKELYLTPGGHYTSADIAANGNVTASQKFKGLKSDHNMNPKVGDTLCPISGTKANPKFTWTIGGKAYQFCCPPCVDEFLTNAKTSSEPLPDPESFIKK